MQDLLLQEIEATTKKLLELITVTESKEQLTEFEQQLKDKLRDVYLTIQESKEKWI